MFARKPAEYIHILSGCVEAHLRNRYANIYVNQAGGEILIQLTYTEQDFLSTLKKNKKKTVSSCHRVDRDVSSKGEKEVTQTAAESMMAGFVPNVPLSAQVKAGCHELMEGMQKKKEDTGTCVCVRVRARGLSWLRCLSLLLPTEAQGQIRLASDGQTERQWVSVGEDILALQKGEMPTRCSGAS